MRVQTQKELNKIYNNFEAFPFILGFINVTIVCVCLEQLGSERGSSRCMQLNSK